MYSVSSFTLNTLPLLTYLILTLTYEVVLLLLTFFHEGADHREVRSCWGPVASNRWGGIQIQSLALRTSAQPHCLPCLETGWWNASKGNVRSHHIPWSWRSRYHSNVLRSLEVALCAWPCWPSVSVMITWMLTFNVLCKLPWPSVNV